MANELKHVGTPRHSGRYPWGSGENPEQRNKSFLGRVAELEKEGLSEVDVAKGMGMSSGELRRKKALVKAEQKKEDYAQVMRLVEKGMSNVAIGDRMGHNESWVRAIRDIQAKERSEITSVAANMLKDAVDKKKYIDIGAGTERYMGIKRTKLDTAIAQLEESGYTVHYLKIPQLGTNHDTSLRVLAGPGVTPTEVSRNRDQIKLVTEYSEDGGESFHALEPVKHIDSKRIAIRYAEDGGIKKDGVIELRMGVEDISLGTKRYAQVRIGIDGTHYMKGMAMYSDDLPPGVDIMFNTNKSKSLPMNKVLKPLKKNPETGEIDQDNPFGSAVRQKHYIDADGKKQLSALNRIGTTETSGEEGAWGDWKKTLSSQMLSKQPAPLAERQLGLAYKIKEDEYNEIMALTNPAIKKKLLDGFASDCDSSAVHLKAAALPRQGSHVILPLTDIAPNEIYAPNFRQGEPVVLIRYPHGGIFEIPSLSVNNSNPQGKKLLGGARDAVGIHPSVAERLSGADFDGDTVLVIPNPKSVGIKTSKPLEGLIDFEPKVQYRGTDPKTGELLPGVKRMTTAGTGMQMGLVSNLITDMTIQGATPTELARAVRHSMVVIDAEKHGLDYTRSYVDNNIADLKRRYQGKSAGGASTLISRASSQKTVNQRSEYFKVDPTTGKKIYEETGSQYLKTKTLIDPSTGKPLVDPETNRKVRVPVNDKTGQQKVVTRTQMSTKMAEEEDAFNLSSGTIMESIYAEHANKLKALANASRKASLETPRIKYEPSANKAYEKEVAHLQVQLNIALKNAPLERQAQLIGNAMISAKKAANPDMPASEIKTLSGLALTAARNRVGAKKIRIDISPREWEAIQAGAVTHNVLLQILNNADADTVKRLATPRTATKLTPTKEARAKLLLASGHTQAEVADQLGLSVSSINRLIG